MIGNVSAVLIDLAGVLYVVDELISGATEAVDHLRAAGLASAAPLGMTSSTTHSAR